MELNRCKCGGNAMIFSSENMKTQCLEIEVKCDSCEFYIKGEFQAGYTVPREAFEQVCKTWNKETASTIPPASGVV